MTCPSNFVAAPSLQSNPCRYDFESDKLVGVPAWTPNRAPTPRAGKGPLIGARRGLNETFRTWVTPPAETPRNHEHRPPSIDDGPIKQRRRRSNVPWPNQSEMSAFLPSTSGAASPLLLPPPKPDPASTASAKGMTRTELRRKAGRKLDIEGRVFYPTGDDDCNISDQPDSTNADSANEAAVAVCFTPLSPAPSNMIADWEYISPTRAAAQPPIPTPLRVDPTLHDILKPAQSSSEKNPPTLIHADTADTITPTVLVEIEPSLLLWKRCSHLGEVLKHCQTAPLQTGPFWSCQE